MYTGWDLVWLRGVLRMSTVGYEAVEVWIQEGHTAGDFVRIINREYDNLNPGAIDSDFRASQVIFDIEA
jgi:hypothetical protein